MSTKADSSIYQSGEYYQKTYVKNSMDLNLSRLWMTNYYRVLCRIFPKFKFMKNKEILELGSGFGGYINLLYTLGYRHITASDMCRDIYNPSPSYPFKLINIEKYKSPKKYDVINAFDVMEHVNHSEIAVKNIYELLKSNGYFMFCVPCPVKKHLLDPFHTNMQYPNFYTNLFNRLGFRLIDYKTISFIPFIWRFGFHFSFPGIVPHRFFISETFFVFQKI